MLKRHEPAPVALHAVADDSAGEISANSIEVQKNVTKMVYMHTASQQ
jgi:hypothetical protein